MTTFDYWKRFSYQTDERLKTGRLLHRHFSNDANGFMGKFAHFFLISLLLSITHAKLSHSHTKTKERCREKGTKMNKIVFFNESKICWLWLLPPKLLLLLLLLRWLLFYKMLLITILFNILVCTHVVHGTRIIIVTMTIKFHFLWCCLKSKKIAWTLYSLASLLRPIAPHVWMSVGKPNHIFGSNK